MGRVRKLREKRCATRVPPLQESKKGEPKVGGFAAHFACGFFEFWRGGTRSRIVYLEVFAKFSLILADDNSAFRTLKLGVVVVVLLSSWNCYAKYASSLVVLG